MTGAITLLVAVTACSAVAAICWKKEDAITGLRHSVGIGALKKGQLYDGGIDNWLKQAGMQITGEEWLIINFLCLLTPTAIAQLLQIPFSISPLIGIGCCVIANTYVQQHKSQRQKQIDVEIEGVLLDMAASLWTNPSIKVALETARDEASGLMKADLDRVIQEIDHGLNIDHALQRWGDRNKGEVLKLCVRTVIICRMTGGKLAPVLEKLAKISRERSALKKEIDAQVVQPKATAIAVSIVPVVFLLLAGAINPGYISYLWKPSGLLFLLYGIVSVMCGFLCLRRQARSVIGER